MAEADTQQPPEGEELEPIPFMQRILDNPFILLILGITVPTILYIVWGVMEVIQSPMAK